MSDRTTQMISAAKLLLLIWSPSSLLLKSRFPPLPLFFLLSFHYSLPLASGTPVQPGLQISGSLELTQNHLVPA